MAIHLPYYDDVDKKYADMLRHISFFKGELEEVRGSEAIKTYKVHMPTEEYSFLHEAAVICFRGVLYASWYLCPKQELKGRTPVCGRRSYDRGKTWSELEIIADDPTGRLMYCPPVYGICDGRLYLFINEMWGGPDLIHALDLFVLNEETGQFEQLWTRPIPFKVNTNVCTLPGGKLMLPGRIAELDGFPNTPAVLLSDTGKIDGEWRLVKLQETGELADGAKLVHPELTAIHHQGMTYIFSRNDERKVPLVYLSEDLGEHWQGPFSHDIPFSNSKIYAGTLSNGKHYIIGNIYPGRGKLALLVSEPDGLAFTKCLILQDGFSEVLGFGEAWHYPCAFEDGGMLYVIYTVNITGVSTRGAVLSAIPLSIL